MLKIGILNPLVNLLLSRVRHHLNSETGRVMPLIWFVFIALYGYWPGKKL